MIASANALEMYSSSCACGCCCVVDVERSLPGVGIALFPGVGIPDRRLFPGVGVDIVGRWWEEGTAVGRSEEVSGRVDRRALDKCASTQQSSTHTIAAHSQYLGSCWGVQGLASALPVLVLLVLQLGVDLSLHAHGAFNRKSPRF